MCAMFIFISIFGTDWLTEVSWKWSFGWKFSYLMTGNETVDVWICDYVLLGNGRKWVNKGHEDFDKSWNGKCDQVTEVWNEIVWFIIDSLCIYYVSFHGLII